jgi:hypothetical protein
MKATMRSLGGDLGTRAALEIEPVLSSLAGGCLPLVVALKTAKNPITRTATNPIPSRVPRTANRCRILIPKPVKACIPPLEGPLAWEW